MDILRGPLFRPSAVNISDIFYVLHMHTYSLFLVICFAYKHTHTHKLLASHNPLMYLWSALLRALALDYVLLLATHLFWLPSSLMFLPIETYSSFRACVKFPLPHEWVPWCYIGMISMKKSSLTTLPPFLKTLLLVKVFRLIVNHVYKADSYQRIPANTSPI